MRYVAYVRISSEEQRGNYSLAAQKHAIEAWIARRLGEQAGHLIRLYADECYTGTTDERPALQQMLTDARSGQFDALVVHKWDRLARSRLDAARYKVILRRECSIKLFAAEGVSEDEDEFVGMLFEAMIEVWSEFYSRNLSNETRKGKQEKASQGKHNNPAPYGTEKTQGGLLIPHDEELPGLLLALTRYAEGGHSDNRVAEVLDQAGYRTKQGKRFTGEMVRHMLQNRVYVGQIRYQAYERRADGSRDKSVKSEWFKALHAPIVPVESFERCQEMRRQRRGRGRNDPHFLVYPLSGLLYCCHCRLRLRAQKSPTGKRYYRCVGTASECTHQMVQADVLEEQVGDLLAKVYLPVDWRTRQPGGESDWAQRTQRARELQQSSERLDFRWDMGFIEKNEYLSKRAALQAQLVRNQPLAEQELAHAEKIWRRFQQTWPGGDAAQQKDLLLAMLERVSLNGRIVETITLRPAFLHLARQVIDLISETDAQILGIARGGQNGCDHPIEKRW